MPRRLNSKAIRPEMTVKQIRRRVAVLNARREGAPTPAELRDRIAKERRGSMALLKPPYVRVMSLKEDIFQHGDLMGYHAAIRTDACGLSRQRVEAALAIGLKILAEQDADSL